MLACWAAAHASPWSSRSRRKAERSCRTVETAAPRGESPGCSHPCPAATEPCSCGRLTPAHRMCPLRPSRPRSPARPTPQRRRPTIGDDADGDEPPERPFLRDRERLWQPALLVVLRQTFDQRRNQSHHTLGGRPVAALGDLLAPESDPDDPTWSVDAPRPRVRLGQSRRPLARSPVGDGPIFMGEEYDNLLSGWRS